MIQRIALGANAGGTLDAITHEAITVTSQYEDFHRQRDRLVRPALQVRQREVRAQARAARSSDLVRHARARAPRPASMRSNARWTSLRSRSSSIRSSCACGAIRIATRTTTGPTAARQLRECYRQGAEAFGWDKRNPEPRSMRDGSELVGWGMATGVWEALQMPTTVRIVLTADGHAEVSLRDLRYRHRHLHDHGAGRGRHARACRSTTSASSSATRRCRNRRSRADRGSRPRCANGIAATASAVRDELLRLAKADAELAARGRQRPTTSRSPTARS